MKLGRSPLNTVANVSTVGNIFRTQKRARFIFASRATPNQGFRMTNKNRIDPYLEEKLKPNLLDAATKLQRLLEKYDQASGRKNAPQLKAQLARFIKKMRS